MFRIGTGFDVHKLVENRKLIICGVEISRKIKVDKNSESVYSIVVNQL